MKKRGNRQELTSESSGVTAKKERKPKVVKVILDEVLPPSCADRCAREEAKREEVSAALKEVFGARAVRTGRIGRVERGQA